jgi:hypothetical protein
MFRRTATGLATFGAFACAALSGGCADLMQRSTIAPEWFQAKAVEVKGEGYPELAEVPELRGSTADQAEWDKTRKELQAASARFDRDLAAAGAIPTDEEIRARQAQLQALLDGSEAATDGVQP